MDKPERIAKVETIDSLRQKLKRAQRDAGRKGLSRTKRSKLKKFVKSLRAKIDQKEGKKKKQTKKAFSQPTAKITASQKYEANSDLHAFESYSDELLDDCYEIVEDSVYGKVLRATKNITKGTIIIKEEPLFWTIPNVTTYEQQLEAFLHFSSDLRREISTFYAVEFKPNNKEHCKVRHVSQRTRQKPFDEIKDEEIEHFFRVLHTNSFPYRDKYTVLYRTICKAFHSCDANASHTSYRYDGAGCLWAKRDIFVGELISVSYVDGKMLSHKYRQERLQTQYGFECKCKRCTSGVDVVRGFPCPNKNCGGTIYTDITHEGEWECNSCGSNFHDGDIQTLLGLEKNIADYIHDFEVGIGEGGRMPDDWDRVLAETSCTLGFRHWTTMKMLLLDLEKEFATRMMLQQMALLSNGRRLPPYRGLSSDKTVLENCKIVVDWLEEMNNVSSASRIMVNAAKFAESKKKWELAAKYFSLGIQIWFPREGDSEDVRTCRKGLALATTRSRTRFSCRNSGTAV